VVQVGSHVQRGHPSMFRGPGLAELQIASAVMPNDEFREMATAAGLSVVERRLDDVTYAIAHREDLIFYEEPMRSRSEDSGAIYLAERDDGVRSLWLQYLPPFTLTSRHFHRLTEEEFHGLEGRCVIEASNGNIVLENCSVLIRPGTIHQLRTEETPSLALLEMRNPQGLNMDDHFYVSN